MTGEQTRMTQVTTIALLVLCTGKLKSQYFVVCYKVHVQIIHQKYMYFFQKLSQESFWIVGKIVISGGKLFVFLSAFSSYGDTLIY